MTNIDTTVAEKHYNSKQGEIEYLDRIQYVDFNEDGQISLLADEEGNRETILTPKAARWVAGELLRLADEKEGYR